MLTMLAIILLFMAVVMTLAWVVQRAAGNSGWIDVFWTYGTGAAGVIAALWPTAGASASRQQLVAAIVALWAVRLGTYILLRVAHSETEDARYAKFKEEWGPRYQSRIYWLILPQALITTIMMVSVHVAAARPHDGLDLRDGLGVAILLIAIGGESLADWQLARFKKTNTRKHAINDIGLWGWSRHPNYFFEWFGWLSFPVIAFSLVLPFTWLTLLAPIMMFIVLRFITGVPPLEATMLKSRGKAFVEYQNRVSAFIPLPPKHVLPKNLKGS
jgi:steroid 5-alpha reductase family enzyme